jgi:hypothetical protein
MQPSSWLRAVAWIVVVGILIACSPVPGSSLRARPTSSISVPGLEELGLLAEYRLDLALDPAERQLAGRQQVTIPNHSGVEWQEIVFRLYPNLPQYGGRIDIGPVWVDGQRTASSLRAEETSLVIPLVHPLQSEASITVSMTFQVTIPKREGGYVLFGYSQGIWSLPDAYPLLAVHDGERWHEDIAPPHGDAVFADVALYEVTLSLPPTLTLVTTGSVVGDTAGVSSPRAYRIIGGPLREFALLASAEYRMAETTARGALVRSYYLPEDEPAGKAALNSAAAALRAYAGAFGPYPFPELTVVEAPLEFYGMEYPGVNLIGVTLYGERRTQLEDRVVHEIAHQWWYAQVGNDQVNTPWLDEGLAEYSMATYYRQVYGESRANTLINQRWLVPYQTAVENGFDAVVNQPSAAFGPEYEVIVYAKAAMFFNALRQQLGDRVYQAVLQEYVDRYRWRIATPDDFLAVAESVSGRDLDTLYNRWILSKQ